MPPVEATCHMWAVFVLIGTALAFYIWDRFTIELTSLGVISALMLFFELFPLPDGELDATRFLEGFGNPALIAVVALLVIGQGLIRSGLLDQVARLITRTRRTGALFSIIVVLLMTAVLSAFLNNTPVVVIFIPILQALAHHVSWSASSVMIPMSFAAILGGSTTLIGSSTNLLVSGTLAGLGLDALTMFEFTVPALVLASTGMLYTVFVAPRLLPDRSSPAAELVSGGSGGRQFIGEVTVGRNSKLIGEQPAAGLFPSLKDVTVRLVQRGERAYLPPFEGLTIRRGDVIVMAATRDALTNLLKRDPGLTTSDEAEGEEGGKRPRESQLVVEVMVAPASRLIGQNLEQIGFRYRFGCIVLGIQRRSRMIRTQMSEIRLEAGDVLLIQGRRTNVHALRGNQDMLLMEWSAADMPEPSHARRAVLIFLAVIAAASSGMVSIAIAAVAGAAAMIAVGCLNVRQASRAIDRRIIMLIAASLAMGMALQQTGGAEYIAHNSVALLDGAGPSILLSMFFLVVALLTNVISNNACAVLFTPIAVSMAGSLGVDPHIFAIAVLFAANCSFASPIGYQTNLLVMGPGHYKFVDFVKAGLPLLVVVWLTFSVFAPYYYDLP